MESIRERLPDGRIVMVSVLIVAVIVAGLVQGISAAQEMLTVAFIALGALWILEQLEPTLEWIEQKASA